VIGESAAQGKELTEGDDYLSGICSDEDLAERVKAESEQRAARRPWGNRIANAVKLSGRNR
jgi:hypothetical protein